MDLKKIKEAVLLKSIRITEHAFQELENDSLILRQVTESIHNGEVIENYPNSKPLPSCLILGFFENSPIHSVWAYNAISKKATLITVYRPDPLKWVKYKVRVK